MSASLPRARMKARGFPDAQDFPENARRALRDAALHAALGKAQSGFTRKRAEAMAALPERDALRDAAQTMKDHTIAHLDLYLARFETQARAAGTQVHWASNAAEACAIAGALCRERKARRIVKSKSMVSEEIGLNKALEAEGMAVTETDLGEYIIQLRDEPPSHIIAPAVHLRASQIAQGFRAAHTDLPPARPLDNAAQLVGEARAVLRTRFLCADIGITGANMLIAQTGQSVTVTNEGNGALTQNLPRTHIVITGIEKVVPTWEDAALILRLLGRSATGQAMTVYTSFACGPRREGDPDGPEERHVILLDNGRSALLGTHFQPMLRCIRCGACLNHCPVYQRIGGHAYGSPYSGPMGAVLTPAIRGAEAAAHLPNASSLCGRCEAICPMRIPLPRMMRHWRERLFAQKLVSPSTRLALSLWSRIALRPRLYALVGAVALRMMRLLAGRRGILPRRTPFLGGWMKMRDFPAPEGECFQAQWMKHQRNRRGVS